MSKQSLKALLLPLLLLLQENKGRQIAHANERGCETDFLALEKTLQVHLFTGLLWFSDASISDASMVFFIHASVFVAAEGHPSPASSFNDRDACTELCLIQSVQSVQD